MANMRLIIKNYNKHLSKTTHPKYIENNKFVFLSIRQIYARCNLTITTRFVCGKFFPVAVDLVQPDHLTVLDNDRKKLYQQ